MLEAATRDGPNLTVIGMAKRRRNEYTHHIHVAQSPVSLQIPRPQAVGELEHPQQHGESAEKSVRHQVPSHRREMLRDLGRGIEDAGVLHVGDEYG